MSKKKILYPAIVILIILAAYLVVFGFPTSGKTEYEFATVGRGTVESAVSATGTLSPTTSVEVGTQISGLLDSVYVDYNDRVTSGQILAVLDTFSLRMAVIDAQANVEKSEAQLGTDESNFSRCTALYGQGMISEEDYLQCRMTLKSDSASLKSAHAGLARSNQNMRYAIIRSPINGIVISKNVEKGQTVAASLSAPTLFVIAQDLARMEILADVDESDIGQVRTGQEVRFQVTTYSDRKFKGTVSQIRLEPRTVSNVVTYTVVVEADNGEGLLLPGMTAQIEIIIDKRPDVLLVPNKALRFNPPTEVAQSYWEQRRKQAEANGPARPHAQDSTTAADQARSVSGTGTQNGTGGGNRNRTVVWYLDSTGQLAAAPFKAGLADATSTEVLASRDITEGMKVIISSTSSAESKTTTNSNSQSGRPPGFRPF